MHICFEEILTVRLPPSFRVCLVSRMPSAIPTGKQKKSSTYDDDSFLESQTSELNKDVLVRRLHENDEVRVKHRLKDLADDRYELFTELAFASELTSITGR